jgi:hypothetical protein
MEAVRLLLWAGVGLWIGIPLALFVGSTVPVSLRSRSVGRSAAIALIGYVALLLVDARAFRGAELVLFYFLLLLALLLLSGSEWWLVRADAATVQERIATGCAGLFLTCEPLSGIGVRLTARGVESRLRLVPLGKRLTGVTLPRPGGKGKVALLVNWLTKQYPGSLPRLRIRLK